MDKILTKNDLLNKLRSYTTNPDDDVIRFKDKIKTALLNCPELLYALNYEKLNSELFNDDGTLNATYDDKGNVVPLGEWDRFFGYSIRPYVFLPETQIDTDNFLCYTVSFNEQPRYNDVQYFANIVFTVLCNSSYEQAIDNETGISRSDLIACIIRERFNWSNIFGTQCKLKSSTERVLDSRYIARVLTFECTLPNHIVKTPLGGKTRIINNEIRK